LREFQLRETKISAYASLIGHVGRSFRKTESDEQLSWMNNTQDLFHVNATTFNLPKLTKAGDWNPDRYDYAKGKWCYDTPGTVNENQILNKLLLPELMKVLPKTTLKPRSFFIREGRTLFVGGIARIDYIGGSKPIRLTVFASGALPVTVVETVDADDIYEKALGTPIFGVPMGNKERLSQFPALKPREFQVEGLSEKVSCNDIVVSGAGWVAVTAGKGDLCRLRVHSPNGAGIFLRQPSLLPNMIRLKGKRVRDSVAYGKHQVFVPKPKKFR
jgi:ribosome biogenesis GTPase A